MENQTSGYIGLFNENVTIGEEGVFDTLTVGTLTATDATITDLAIGNSFTAPSMSLTNDSNQLLLGTNGVTTISDVDTASRTVTIPATGTDTQVVLTHGTQTISGLKDFQNGLSFTTASGLTLDVTTIKTSVLSEKTPGGRVTLSGTLVTDDLVAQTISGTYVDLNGVRFTQAAGDPTMTLDSGVGLVYLGKTGADVAMVNSLSGGNIIISRDGTGGILDINSIGTGSSINIQAPSSYINLSTAIETYGTITPRDDSVDDLGSVTKRYNTLYATNGQFTTVSGTTVNATTGNFTGVTATTISGSAGYFNDLSVASGLTFGGSFNPGSISTGTISGTVINASTRFEGDLTASTISGGTVTASTGFYAPDGSITAPSYSFSNDTNVGMFLVGTDRLAITTGGGAGDAKFTFGSISGNNAIPAFDVNGGSSQLSGPAIRFNRTRNLAAVTSGLYLGELQFRGYDGADLYQGAQIGAQTTQAWTSGTAYGSKLLFNTTAANATALATRLTIDENAATATVPYYAPVGSISAPSYSFSTDTDTGMYWGGTGVLRFTNNGDVGFSVDPTWITLERQAIGNAGSAATPSYAFIADGTTGMYLTSSGPSFSEAGVERVNIGRMDNQAGNARITVYGDHTATQGPNIHFSRKSTGGAVSANHFLGQLRYQGYDGSSYQLGAAVIGTATHTWSSGKLGTKLDFYNVLSGTSAANNALSIANNQLLGPDGSATAPAYSFSTDTDTGIYRHAGNTLGIAAGGGTSAYFTSNTAYMPETIRFLSGGANLKYVRSLGGSSGYDSTLVTLNGVNIQSTGLATTYYMRNYANYTFDLMQSRISGGVTHGVLDNTAIGQYRFTTLLSGSDQPYSVFGTNFGTTINAIIQSRTLGEQSATNYGGNLEFYTVASGATSRVLRLTVANDGVTSVPNLYAPGISFDGGTNTLSDFEEGTYTPTLTDSSNVTFTGLTRAAQYQRIGNKVFVTGYVSWTGKGSAAAGSSVRIGGLPFTVDGSGYSRGLAYASWRGSAVNDNAMVSPTATTTYMNVILSDNASETIQTVSNFKTAGTISWSCHYNTT